MDRGRFIQAEVASQPDCWRRAAEVAAGSRGLLPRHGERVAVVGCGTSWFMAQAYASLRESAGQGETDAFAASEMPEGRGYDRLVAITRSGTTTEVLTLLGRVRGRQPTLAITGDPASPVAGAADQTIVLDFADERSVVQTRFATTALSLLRAHLGFDLAESVADARAALDAPLPVEPGSADRWAFLGRGWTVGLASEAALKLRESAQAWTEAYPAFEYRHGPISIAAPGRVVWSLDGLDPSLATELQRIGATVVVDELDPLASLVVVQRTAVALAAARGLDPDRPRNLARAVILADHDLEVLS
jgi:fructoselysine-6-P-deglycase FrlB-like protein